MTRYVERARWWVVCEKEGAWEQLEWVPSVEEEPNDMDTKEEEAISI